MTRNRVRGRGNYGTDLVADLPRKLPPALFPGTHATFCPALRVCMRCIEDRAWHCTKGIADQVRGVGQNGEFGAVAQQVVAVAAAAGGSDCGHAQDCTGACMF